MVTNDDYMRKCAHCRQPFDPWLGQQVYCAWCNEQAVMVWPSIGLSIRRFVRRAEVADIRRDVLMMTVEAAAAAMHGATRSGEEIIRRQAKALDRLAALAMLEVE